MNSHTKSMSGRKRFQETMRYGTPDRVPYFEEGIREEVVKAWQRQGLSKKTKLSRMFPCDRREKIVLDLEPHPTLTKLPADISELEKKLRRRLNPDDNKRLPQNWSTHVRTWSDREHALMLYVHRGFFKTIGVRDGRSFLDRMYLLMDKPDFVRRMMEIQGEFSARLAERVLQDVEIDAAVFSEPIGGNDRPLLSPQMYQEFVLKSYEPLLEVLNRYGVETIVFQTYANASVLIASILRWGFNCLWACEVNIEAMDYRRLRREFGRELRLIGGIDLDALRHDKAAIRREIEEKVPSLIADGGYVPLADGRIREDVPFENYVYYRRLLEKVTQ